MILDLKHSINVNYGYRLIIPTFWVPTEKIFQGDSKIELYSISAIAASNMYISGYGRTAL